MAEKISVERTFYSIPNKWKYRFYISKLHYLAIKELKIGRELDMQICHRRMLHRFISLDKVLSDFLSFSISVNKKLKLNSNHFGSCGELEKLNDELKPEKNCSIVERNLRYKNSPHESTSLVVNLHWRWICMENMYITKWNFKFRNHKWSANEKTNGDS